MAARAEGRGLKWFGFGTAWVAQSLFRRLDKQTADGSGLFTPGQSSLFLDVLANELEIVGVLTRFRPGILGVV